jgi:hypothetical protein
VATSSTTLSEKRERESPNKELKSQVNWLWQVNYPGQTRKKKSLNLEAAS